MDVLWSNYLYLYKLIKLIAGFITPDWLCLWNWGAAERGFQFLNSCHWTCVILHVTCQFFPGVPSPACTPKASLRLSRCSRMKGAVLGPEVYQEHPVKPHMGPKLSSMHAGKRSSEPSNFANKCALLMWNVHTPLCHQLWGASIDVKHHICIPKGISAGPGSWSLFSYSSSLPFHLKQSDL